MRAGLAFSAVLFASPKQFAPIPPESITVDIVPAVTLGQDFEERRPAESAAARQPPGLDRRQDPKQNSKENPQTGTASASLQPSGKERRPGPREPIRDEPAQPEPPPNLLVFSATVAPVQDLPLPTGGVQNATGGFDAPADSTAKLAAEEIAAFRSHLQKCWNPPAAIADAQKLKVVLRVSLKPNGTLTGSPILLEASASAHGPALLQTAVAALRQCQPYSFLPAGKYQEWKLLDLSFSPRGMSGG